MAAQICDLPNELLLKIFGFLDGASIARCSSICKQWNAVTTLILQCNGAWHAMCTAEIDSTILAELTRGAVHRSEHNSSADEAIDWLKVYIWWYGTASVGTQKHDVRHFDIDGQSSIICANVSGSGIVTGHKDGTVTIRDVSGNWRVLTEHSGPISDIAFVDVVRKGHYADDFTTCHHHHVITSSHDHSIRITSLCHRPGPIIEYFGSAVLQVKVSDDVLAVLLHLNVVILYKINLQECTSGNQISLTRMWSNSFASMGQVWMGFHGTKVHIMGTNNTVREINIGSRAEGVWGVSFRRRWDSDQPLYPMYPTRITIERGSVFIMTTATQDLCMSADGQYFTSYPAGLEMGHVTAVALNGALLAVALSHGVLNLYHVASVSDVTRLHLSAPQWTKKLANDALNSVCISHGVDGAPLIVACTLRQVYVLQWGL